jgi:hypothetical protein
MREYVVYRHGFNEKNQDPARGLPEKMPVARVRADTPEDACERAKCLVSLESGQSLSAEPAEVVDAEVNKLDLRIETLERLEEQ